MVSGELPVPRKFKRGDILASTDPLAVDQAAIDMVYRAADSGSLIERIESRHGLRTLDAAAEIGLGKRAYRLVEVK